MAHLPPTPSRPQISRKLQGLQLEHQHDLYDDGQWETTDHMVVMCHGCDYRVGIANPTEADIEQARRWVRNHEAELSHLLHARPDSSGR